jgi:hypothetical protein
MKFPLGLTMKLPLKRFKDRGAVMETRRRDRRNSPNVHLASPGPIQANPELRARGPPQAATVLAVDPCDGVPSARHGHPLP